eukprot:Gb_32530 [translate_table: standard]
MRGTPRNCNTEQDKLSLEEGCRLETLANSSREPPNKDKGHGIRHRQSPCDRDLSQQKRFTKDSRRWKGRRVREISVKWCNDVSGWREMEGISSCAMNAKFTDVLAHSPALSCRGDYKLQFGPGTGQTYSVEGTVSYQAKYGIQSSDGGNLQLWRKPNPSRCLPESNTGEKRWVHFVGIGGSGLSALAMLALKQVSSFTP